MSIVEKKIELSDIKSAVSQIKIEIEEDSSKLSEEHKQIIKQLYGEGKNISDAIFGMLNVDNIIKVTKLIGEIIKLLERTSYLGKKILGSDKKIIAIELCRNLIESEIHDNNVRESLLVVYNMFAEDILDQMIDVSKNVNMKEVKELAVSWCEKIVECLGKK
jgi:hypothetical protein